jgi:S1-C subfamily serine protease
MPVSMSRRAPKLLGFRSVLLVSALLAITWYALPRWSAYFQAAEAAPRATTERGELTSEEQQNIDIFEKWKASVVYIATSDRVMDFWTRNVTNVPRGTGSGFIWDTAGHVVTNVHVIAGAAAANVKLADGRDYEATLVGASVAHDIAVLQIRVPKNLPQPVAVGTTICESDRRYSRSAIRSVWTGP